MIHGGVNGYSRRIIYLSCCGNKTVLHLFVMLFTSLVCQVGNRGGENVDVAAEVVL